jgi:hypothetical protein
MPAQATNLFLLGDLEDSSRTSKLADSDGDSLRVVMDWITTFVTQPHKDLGRTGSTREHAAGARPQSRPSRRKRLTNWRSREG